MLSPSPSVRRARSAADRLLAAEALMWLATARLLVLLLPYRALQRILARDDGAAQARPAAENVQRIAWALNAAGRRAPWRCKCLEKAVAGSVMLRARRYPATVFFGVARAAPAADLRAHAWLRCGDLPVVGEEAPVDGYAVVARLASGPPESRRA